MNIVDRILEVDINILDAMLLQPALVDRDTHLHRSLSVQRVLLHQVIARIRQYGKRKYRKNLTSGIFLKDRIGDGT